MNILQGKKIVLGITGSIATFKVPTLVRELVKMGADVHCVMTPSSENFVTPMVLANLSQNPVIRSMFSEEIQNSGAWHIHLARECDAMLIAPCSASTLGKIVHGISDNALVTVATAVPVEIPLIISPAMDSNMWINPLTQNNAKLFKELRGGVIIPPDDGDLSSGLVGPGRFPEISVVIETLINEIKKKQNRDLEGKRVLITAGPTQEKIDEVRYISNYSSGKMGFAIANEVAERGGEVILIAGPVSNIVLNSNIKRIDVITAEEMFIASMSENNNIDIAIHTAAVADFTPKETIFGKMKKKDAGMEIKITMEQTKDILGTFGKNKDKSQYLVGFALEYTNIKEYGREKLELKKCDMVVINLSVENDAHLTGAIVECYEAIKQGKVVYAFTGDKPRSEQANSPWLRSFITKEFGSMEELVTFLQFDEII